MSLAHFELDPRYGEGTYRRRVRLRRRRNAVAATIDDTHHSMWLLLRHRDGKVVSVDADIERGPATSCGGAPARLSSIVGTALAASSAEITSRLVPADNCTHLADLLRWAFRAARNGTEAVDYDIAVPDQGSEPVWLEIWRDETLVHRWKVDGETIVAPASLAGCPLLSGFLGWARLIFDESDLEAAVMLQRGTWVARGRRYIVDRSIVPLSAATGMENACFSYSGANWAAATNNLGYVRDFSDGWPESPLPGRVVELLGEDHDAAG